MALVRCAFYSTNPVLLSCSIDAFSSISQSEKMCGRFALTLPSDAVAGWFDAVLRSEVEGPRYNICPTQQIPVCVTFEAQRVLTPMRWGFIPHWYKSPSDGPLLINARSETITVKPSFRSAIMSRRCLIPASGFYEWLRDKSKPKEPWYITPKDNSLMAFAGIWQAWTSAEGGRHICCAIITTSAPEPLAQIHHRAPVAIAPNDFDLWMSGSGRQPLSLLKEASQEYFSQHRVDPKINTARFDLPELIDEV